MTEIADTTPLAIFPLSVVLVPGELLPLHIFEDRYQQMVNDALQDERRFGLSFVSEAGIGRQTPPPSGSIGCIAQISAVIPLPEGRMNILTIGAERYVVRKYNQYEPYLVAQVDLLEDDPYDESELAPLTDEVRDLFRRLTAAARTLNNESADETPQLDVSAEALSFLVVANIALDNDVKQELLELTDTRERLIRMRNQLRDLVDTYEYRAVMHTRSKSNGHGHEPPDLEE